MANSIFAFCDSLSSSNFEARATRNLNRSICRRGDFSIDETSNYEQIHNGPWDRLHESSLVVVVMRSTFARPCSIGNCGEDERHYGGSLSPHRHACSSATIFRWVDIAGLTISFSFRSFENSVLETWGLRTSAT